MQEKDVVQHFDFFNTAVHRSGVKFFVVPEIFVHRFSCFEKEPFVQAESGAAASTLLFSRLMAIGNTFLLVKKSL